MWVFLLPLCSFSVGIFDRLAIPSYRNLTLSFDYRRKFIAPGQLFSFSQTAQRRNVAIKGLSVQRSLVSLITSYNKIPGSVAMHRCTFDSFLSAPVVIDSALIESMSGVTVENTVLAASRPATETPATFTVDKCIFRNCVVARGGNFEYDNSGGALFLRGQKLGDSENYATFDAKITSTEFIQCKAGNRGGAIYAQGESTLTISDCLFKECESATKNALGFGAAICYSGGTQFLLEYTKFINNKPNEKEFGSVIDVDGVMSVDIQHIAIIGSVFQAGITGSSADIIVTGNAAPGGISNYANLIDICFLETKSLANVYNIYITGPSPQCMTAFSVVDCSSDRSSEAAVIGTAAHIEYTKKGFWRLGTDYDMCPYRPTIAFTHSNVFTPTNELTVSQQFTETEHISASHEFSLSHDFSASSVPDMTAVFTESGAFSASKLYPESAQFSESAPMSMSETLNETESESLSPTTEVPLITEIPTDTFLETETPSEEPVDPTATPADSGLSLEFIIIIAAAAVVLLVIIIAVVIVCMRKRMVAFKEPDSDPLDEGVYDIPHANM